MATLKECPATRHTGDDAHAGKVEMPNACSGARSITAAASLNQLLFSYLFTQTLSIYLLTLVFLTLDLTF